MPQQGQDSEQSFLQGYRLRWFLASQISGLAKILEREAKHGPTKYPTSATTNSDGGFTIRAVHLSELGAQVSRTMPATWLAVQRILRELLDTDSLNRDLVQRIETALHEARGLTKSNEPSVDRDVARVASTLRNLESEIEAAADNVDHSTGEPKVHPESSRIGSKGWSRPMSKAESGRLLGGTGTADNCRKHLKSLTAGHSDVMKGNPRGKQRFCLAWVETIEPTVVDKFRAASQES